MRDSKTLKNLVTFWPQIVQKKIFFHKNFTKFYIVLKKSHMDKKEAFLEVGIKMYKAETRGHANNKNQGFLDWAGGR